jgi:uncharacterized protein (DUF362 family)
MSHDQKKTDPQQHSETSVSHETADTPAVGRRRAIATIAAGAAAVSPLAQAAALFLPGPAPGAKSAPSRSLVAIGRRSGLVTAAGALEGKLLESGLGAAVARAAGEKTPVAAMRRLFKSNDIVGIKVNTLGGRGVSTRPEVALQLAAWLQAAGVPADHISIWDRSDRELRSAGYTLSQSGVRVFGTNDAWGDLVDWGPSASRFARLIEQDLTAVISCAILKDHYLAGVTLSMKNWYGVVHNPNKMHEDGCNPFVAPLSAHKVIRGKLRLNVVDGALGQANGGPSRVPRFAWPFSGFLASTDPVATDAVGWRLLEARRKEIGLPTLAAERREPRYIAEAAKLGLGVADPARIEQLEV